MVRASAGGEETVQAFVPHASMVHTSDENLRAGVSKVLPSSAHLR
jgi:hypothetical protein